MASREIEGYLFTTLRTAARTGNLRVLKQMIKKGADMNMNNYVDKTGLMLAAENGHLEAVKLLINAGADVNDRTRHGATSLSLAAEKNHVECISALVQAGANVHFRYWSENMSSYISCRKWAC